MDASRIDISRPGAWALLLRHAERHSIEGKGLGIDVPLTDQGRVDARAMGATLSPFPLHKVMASPVYRCRDTALQLCLGHGLSQTAADEIVQDEPTLANAFVHDIDLVRQTFDNGNPVDIVRQHLNGHDVPGLQSVAAGCSLMLDTITTNVQPGQLTLMVSHDALVMPFLQHYAGRDFRLQGWAHFLASALVYVEGDVVTVEGQRVHQHAA